MEWIAPMMLTVLGMMAAVTGVGIAVVRLRHREAHKDELPLSF